MRHRKTGSGKSPYCNSQGARGASRTAVISWADGFLCNPTAKKVRSGPYTNIHASVEKNWGSIAATWTNS